ncbi:MULTISPECIES: hypothetical protein [Pseudomonas]|uniref:Uncharacterized protein n=1 Tax=Pseudomonas lutea TaxID=243924 RepID=A0A9X8MH34_9PSED|nr:MULTISPECIES: hypothetical protein [Pseudomonas]SER36506.1 hypothetical protein SAMN05216409_11855 [Pseudomonas lutea]
MSRHNVVFARALTFISSRYGRKAATLYVRQRLQGFTAREARLNAVHADKAIRPCSAAEYDAALLSAGVRVEFNRLGDILVKREGQVIAMSVARGSEIAYFIDQRQKAA